MSTNSRENTPRENVRRRKTKIVATIGPASESREVISGLIEAGMDVARLNFSHGDHDAHKQTLIYLREEAKKQHRHIAILQDLSGPKLRISKLENGSITLKDDDKITLQYGVDKTGDSTTLYVDAFDPVKSVKPEHKVLLSDGKIILEAKEVSETQVTCTVIAGGVLRSRAGISVPDSKLELSSLTEKDKEDVQWAIKNDIDYLALSFVGHTKDIHDLRDELARHKKKIPIISKFERASSLDHISEIIDESDAVMVARGDLGLELPLERVPGIQKLITESANYVGTPVIIATQMLMSMVEQPRPTRAEVSDVCTAVRDGTDAVMLSEETAIGKYPVEAIRTICRIVEEAEQEKNFGRYDHSARGDAKKLVPDSICFAACNAADKISAAAIIACTQSAASARLAAKYRPRQTLFGATTEKSSLARMALYWGVIPVYMNLGDNASTEDEVREAMTVVREQFGLRQGSRVVITSGLRVKKTGTTNIMEIREIPRNPTTGIIAKANRFLKSFEKK